MTPLKNGLGGRERLKKLYLDTNVFLDYFLDRSGKKIPWNEFAFKLLQRARKCEFEVVVSKALFLELKEVKKMEERVVKEELGQLLGKKLVEQEVREKEVIEAKKIAFENSLPLFDCIHAVISARNGFTLVSRDKHFEKIAWKLPQLEFAFPWEV
jgi:predicted nucleic acid-binding protein